MNKLKKIRGCLAFLLILSFFAGAGQTALAQAASAVRQEGGQDGGNSEGTVPDGEPSPLPTPPSAEETPTAAPEPTASEAPTETPTARPVHTPKPTAKPTPKPTRAPDYGAYKLLNRPAKYYKGGQKGIHYRKVKGEKVYHILSYTTDAVKLNMTHRSRFSVYGGKNKKMVKEKYVKVSASGRIKVPAKWRAQELPVLIRAESKKTGEVCYIYLRLRAKLSCSLAKLKLYENHTGRMSFNYGKAKLDFSMKNKKVAEVDKRGKVTAEKKGRTWLIVRVKDSQKNKIRIRIIVTEEPWIVNHKDNVYDYADMKRDMSRLQSKYSGKIGVFTIGQSWDNRSIYCMRVGNSGASRKLIIDAGIHAREWKNVQLLMKQTENLLRHYGENRERFQSTCLYIIPMSNPDGVALAQYGFDAIKNKALQKKCKKIGHYSTWKNNARGVNLNNNFPAGFNKKGKAKKPDYFSYPGKKAGSEKESQALMRFVDRIHPNAVLNVHSTGSIIYWDFDITGNAHQRQYDLASKIHSFTRYPMMPKSGSTRANGGFADWLVYNKKTPSVTVETGTVMCPLPHSQFGPMYERTKKMFMWFMTEY